MTRLTIEQVEVAFGTFVDSSICPDDRVRHVVAAMMANTDTGGGHHHRISVVSSGTGVGITTSKLNGATTGFIGASDWMEMTRPIDLLPGTSLRFQVVDLPFSFGVIGRLGYWDEFIVQTLRDASGG